MGKSKKVGLLITGCLLFVSSFVYPQQREDDFINLAVNSSLYTDFDKEFRILILNIITHPDSYFKRKEGKTYLTFKVINEEYQIMLDEYALESDSLNTEFLLKSVYGRRSYYRMENGEVVECWYTDRGVKFSNTSQDPSTYYSLETGYYDFMDHVKKFNSFLVQKRTKNIQSKYVRRAYRMVNSIRDTQYSRLKKMINRYERFVEKRLRKQERKLERAKRKYEKQQEKNQEKKGSKKEQGAAD